MGEGGEVPGESWGGEVPGESGRIGKWMKGESGTGQVEEI